MFVTPEIITFASRDTIRLRAFGVGVNWVTQVARAMAADPAKGNPVGAERSCRLGPATVEHQMKEEIYEVKQVLYV
jgi:hypothetical protein